ncbi:MAG: TraR/DksA C4-type zinc finger protein [Gammaproteobacteria bacterium]|nr:TraR/DksA C4-type zinc finger protein [Gammaproteobacteria bacterium]
MNTAELELKKYLMLKQEELFNRLEKLKIERSRDGNPISADFEEQAVEREGEEVLEEVKRITNGELNEIKIALDRLEAGTYGICGECGEEIPLPRLKVVPMAKYCTDCQEYLDGKNK